MKDNSEPALSTNKEAISNATMNLMESSILALWLFDFLGMILLLLEPTFECLNQFNKKR